MEQDTSKATQEQCSNNCVFSIFIPTYNRAHTLPRAFESIESQSFRSFEVVIVDDGSTDGTADLVEKWRSEVTFPVYYYRQENQGKHAAFNTALPHLHGELTIVLDSDDKLADEALTIFYRYWQSIDKAERKAFAGVEGLTAFFDGRIAGHRFPKDTFDSDYIHLHRHYRIRGDKKNAIRTDILRRFPYPQFPGERHVRPSLLWERISKEFKFRYFNEVVQLIEYQEGGLSDNRFRLRVSNPQGFRYYYLEHIRTLGLGDRFGRRLDSYVKYIRFSLLSGIGLRQQLREVDSIVLWLLSLPYGTVKWLRDRIKIRFEGLRNRSTMKK